MAAPQLVVWGRLRCPGGGAAGLDLSLSPDRSGLGQPAMRQQQQASACGRARKRAHSSSRAVRPTRW